MKLYLLILLLPLQLLSKQVQQIDTAIKGMERTITVPAKGVYTVAIAGHVFKLRL